MAADGPQTAGRTTHGFSSTHLGASCSATSKRPPPKSVWTFVGASNKCTWQEVVPPATPDILLQDAEARLSRMHEAPTDEPIQLLGAYKKGMAEAN